MTNTDTTRADRPHSASSRAEQALLIHRLRDMAETHERLEEADSYADTARTLEVALNREPALCGDLLREAAQMLEIYRG